MTLLIALAALTGGFTAGACWEACRRGGSVDLRARLALTPRTTDRSNVHVLPRQRGGAA